jgi:uncharacterized protein
MTLPLVTASLSQGLVEEKGVMGEAVLWRRLDRPGHEYARLLQDETRWQLTGVAVFQHAQQPCRLDYSVICDEQWLTQTGKVTGWVGNKAIDVAVSVDASGTWRINGTECPEVAGSIDLDLNFSPSTNLLPIRRLTLSIGEEAQVKAAWLRFPGFTLEPLEQIYRRVDDVIYRYESAGGQFVANLTVNGVGFVTWYPQVWAAE